MYERQYINPPHHYYYYVRNHRDYHIFISIDRRPACNLHFADVLPTAGTNIELQDHTADRQFRHRMEVIDEQDWGH